MGGDKIMLYPGFCFIIFKKVYVCFIYIENIQYTCIIDENFRKDQALIKNSFVYNQCDKEYTAPHMNDKNCNLMKLFLT